MAKKYMGPTSLSAFSSLVQEDIKENQNGTSEGGSVDLSEILDKIPVPMTAEELREILTNEGGEQNG